jgi:hypothetical protein
MMGSLNKDMFLEINIIKIAIRKAKLFLFIMEYYGKY